MAEDLDNQYGDHAAPEHSAPGPPKRSLRGPLVFWLVLGLISTNVVTYVVLTNRLESYRALARYDGIAEPVEVEERPEFEVINAHEHLYKIAHLENYFEAADRTGIDKTLFVASGAYTFLGDRSRKHDMFDWSNEEILRAYSRYPNRIIPFASIVPHDPNKLEKLKDYVSRGAKGLKLYNGHSHFHEKPLNDPSMMEVYAYCAENNLPICWHVRLGNFGDEFRAVLEQFPDLKVILPHFGVAFYRPKSGEWRQLIDLMESFPNLYVDTSFGTRAILVHGLEMVSKYPEIFRDFFMTYSDRIVMGTDMVVTGNSEKTADWQAACIRACRDVLEKETYYFFMAAKGHENALDRANNLYGKLRGLALPRPVLEQIYETNLERLLGENL